MGKGCDEIFRQGKDLHNFTPVIKMSSNPEKNVGANSLFQKDVYCHFQENILQKGIAMHR